MTRNEALALVLILAEIGHSVDIPYAADDKATIPRWVKREQEAITLIRGELGDHPRPMGVRDLVPEEVERFADGFEHAPRANSNKTGVV